MDIAISDIKIPEAYLMVRTENSTVEFVIKDQWSDVHDLEKVVEYLKDIVKTLEKLKEKGDE